MGRRVRITHLFRLMRATFLAAFLPVFLTACEKPRVASAPAPVAARFTLPTATDPELVWQAARVALPVRGSTSSLITTMGAGISPLLLAGGAPRTRWPVLIMLEGCTGTAPPQLLKALAEQGYVALSLSSEARRHEPLPCAADQDQVQKAAAIYSPKKAELSYAIARLDQLDWVDPGQIFILGFFEAGAVVARMAPAGIAGRLLIGWDCQGAGTGGLNETLLSPVFAVSMAPPVTAADCSAHMGETAENRFLRLPERYPLNVLLEPIVFTQMLQFLDRRLFR